MLGSTLLLKPRARFDLGPFSDKMLEGSEVLQVDPEEHLDPSRLRIPKHIRQHDPRGEARSCGGSLRLRRGERVSLSL